MDATLYAKETFRCSACEEWHTVKPVEVFGHRCGACGDTNWSVFHEGEAPEPALMIVTEGRSHVSPDEEPTESWPCVENEDVFGGEPLGWSMLRAECGGYLEDFEPDEEPVMVKTWQCGDCFAIYDEKIEAQECCRG